MRRAVRFVLMAAALGIGIPLLGQGILSAWSSARTYTADTVPARRVAIVFGAGIYRGGGLSPMLEDRVETAIGLYRAGKVQRLLFTGDNRFVDYNEPGEMTAYAEARGIPAAAIQPDFAGRRTYDSCYRARHIFQLDGAIVVTQAFHVPRALFTCRAVGLDAVAVAADRREYRLGSWAWSQVRELPALIAAVFDVTLGQPAEVMGDPIPIK